MKAIISQQPILENENEGVLPDAPLAYKLPCGLIEPLKDEKEAWRLDMACIAIGCEACQFKTDQIFVEPDIKRAVAMWAAHEKQAITKGERTKEMEQLGTAFQVLLEMSKGGNGAK